MTTADLLRAEGKVEGKAEGKAEGKVEGLLDGWRASLLGLIEARFGAVSKRARERITTADLTRLQRWQQRALTAPDERALFSE
jgi:hypothetical protein